MATADVGALRCKAEISCFKIKGEDYHYVNPAGQLCALVDGEPAACAVGLFAVFDGHGGRRAADFASKQVCGAARARYGRQCRQAATVVGEARCKQPQSGALGCPLALSSGCEPGAPPSSALCAPTLRDLGLQARNAVVEHRLDRLAAAQAADGERARCAPGRR